MAQTSIGKAHIAITGSSAELNKAVSEAEGRLSKFGKTLGAGVLGGIGGAESIPIFGAFMAGGGIAAGISAAIKGVTSLASVMRETAAAADALADDAAAVGASMSGFFALRSSAIGNTEAFDTGMTKLAREIGDAVNGNEEAIKSFKNLGLSVADVAAVKTDEAFIRIAEAIDKLPEATQKAKAAFDIFGKTGQKLMETLGRGREFFRQMELEALNAGAIPSAKFAQSADDIDVSLERASIQWKGFKNSIAESVNDLGLVEVFRSGLEQYTRFVTGARELTPELIAQANQLKAEQEAYVEATKRAEIAVKQAEAAQQKQRATQSGFIKEAQTLNDTLRLQVETFGKSAEEVRVFELAMKAGADATGAFKLDLMAAEAAARQIADMKLGADLAKSTETPLERTAQELEQINRLLLQGTITQELFARGAGKLADELIAAAGIQEKMNTTFPNALERGSQAARTFIIEDDARRNTPELDRNQQLERAIEKLKEGDQRREGNQQKMIDVLKKLKPNVVRF